MARDQLFFLLLLCSAVAGVVATEPNATTTTSSASCPSYRCGDAVDVGYPFWIDGGDGETNGTSSTTHCGYPELRLDCRRDTPVLALPSGDYAVTDIKYGDRTMSVFDIGVFSNSSTCPDVAGRNLTLPPDGPLSLTSRDANLTFLVNCSFDMPLPANHHVACLEGDDRYHSYVFRDNIDFVPAYLVARACQDVVGMPVLRSSLTGSGPLDAVVPALKMGFELSWTPAAGGDCGVCEKTGGLCGHRRAAASDAWAFTCFRTGAKPKSAGSRKINTWVVITLAVIGSIVVILLLVLGGFLLRKKREAEARYGAASANSSIYNVAMTMLRGSTEG
ncbi:hypothetical protein ACQ4PT_055964 [Festuca glaucescens]